MAAKGNEISRKEENNLYVPKYKVNNRLSKINMHPPATGLFQEITSAITRVNDGIKCIKKPPVFE